MILEVLDQSQPPGLAARRVAQGVELQRHAIRDAELIVLGLAWNLRGSGTTLLAIVLAVAALVAIAGLLHPATTAVLEDEPEDQV